MSRKGSPNNGPTPWLIVLYLAADGTIPARDFLIGCPQAVSAHFLATLDAIAAAPPPRFSGGGAWEATRGAMSGWYEVRLTGPRREQFRLFCLLENGTPAELAKHGLERPAIAVITGMRKPWRTTISERDYQRVRVLGKEHRQNHPRRIAT